MLNLVIIKCLRINDMENNQYFSIPIGEKYFIRLEEAITQVSDYLVRAQVCDGWNIWPA